MTRMANHVLIIKSVEAVTDDATELTIDFSYDIDIECPGVTDACAEWEECGETGCPSLRSENTVDWDTRGHIVHDVEHRWLHDLAYWGVRTGACFAEVHGHAVAGELAERERLDVGRYEVTPAFDDGGLDGFDLIDTEDGKR